MLGAVVLGSAVLWVAPRPSGTRAVALRDRADIITARVQLPLHLADGPAQATPSVPATDARSS